MRTNQPYPEGFVPKKYLTYKQVCALPDTTLIKNKLAVNFEVRKLKEHLKVNFIAKYENGIGEIMANNLLRKYEYELMESEPSMSWLCENCHVLSGRARVEPDGLCLSCWSDRGRVVEERL